LLVAHQENVDLAERVRSALDDALPTLDRTCVERPGNQIGPYKLLQQIGEGGFGIVYKATWLKNNQVVAVKRFFLQDIKTKLEYS
jgi:serine/threonine protein kinase